MSNSDNNLISFLKTPSLFSPSPNNRRSSRSRERSRDRRSEIMRNSAVNNQPFTGSNYGGYNQSNNYNSNYNQSNNYNTGYNQSQIYNPSYNPNYNLNLTDTYNNQNYQSSFNNNNRPFSPIQDIYNNNNSSQNQGTYNTNYSYQQGNRTIQKSFEQQRLDNNAVVIPHNNTGVTYATSFQSARVESLQRLDNLVRKIKTQIKILNEKIEVFSNEMIKVVSIQYNSTKEKIYHIVEETFRQSEHYLLEYRKREEMKLTEEINRAMRLLEQQIVHIDAMRNDIQKPYWKNMAGVFITTDFEAKIENLMRQTEGIDVKKLDFNTQRYHLKEIQREVIDKLKGRLDSLKNTEFGRSMY